MPLKIIEQPKIIKIDDNLRLIKPEKKQWDKALPWYQDKDVMYYSEGTKDKVYGMDTIEKMYSYLSNSGELYFIEIKENNKWIAIGDVTLSEKGMPIVLGSEEYRGKGIGKKVLEKLIDRANEIGISKIRLSGIYKYNERSKKAFKSMGFIKVSEDENKEYYEIELL